MRTPLWSWDDLIRASRGRPDGVTSQSITGVSIDTRTVQPGDLFVALKDVRDGHEFVSQAFAKGAAAALVSSTYIKQPGDGALLRVANPLHADDPLNALRAIGIAARTRASKARIVAVTGSAGKTGTKEMLRVCLAACGKVHASEKSYNNHWGVPLTLARMPADTEFGVFEIGMNHAGEITPLSQMVRPHVAIITNVLPVHLGHFKSEAGIAQAKAEIFAGIEPKGTAILLQDSPHFAALEQAAVRTGATVRTFGLEAASDLRLSSREAAFQLDSNSMLVSARPIGDGVTEDIDYELGMIGRHLAINSLAVVLALQHLGCPLTTALPALASVVPPVGRGERSLLSIPGGKVLLVDESYNANPASMKAALRNLSELRDADIKRRIAVLGDMLELGDQADALHKALKAAVIDAGIDLVFASGPHMKFLYDSLPKHLCEKWAPTAEDLRADLLAAIQAGDAVMIKGSLGSRMGLLVEALKSHFSPGT
jgi:UDP-N-acetylmuramoyl-tripeptide--D-alanyl-D-alanine ligase